MNFSHPIHVHLINFQVIAQAKLKFYIPLEETRDRRDKVINCSFYEMDFYRNACDENGECVVYLKNGNMTQLCLDIRNIAYNEDDNSTAKRILKDYLPEN